MKKRQILKASVMLIMLGCATFSCQEKEQAAPPKVIVRPISDERVKAEILSMVDNTKDEAAIGRMLNATGRTKISPYPSGYDYANMVEVIISGQPSITYVALSLTTNTSTRKKSINIYYVGGVYQNFLYMDHVKSYVAGRERNTVRYHVPRSYPSYWSQATAFADDENSILTAHDNTGTRTSCEDNALGCIKDVYENNGWYSIGVAFASLFFWQIPAGVIAGCVVSHCVFS